MSAQMNELLPSEDQVTAALAADRTALGPPVQALL